MFFFLPYCFFKIISYYDSIFSLNELGVTHSLVVLVIIIEIAACFLNLPKSTARVSGSFPRLSTMLTPQNS